MRPQALPVQAEMGRCTQGMQVFSGRVHSAPDSILNCQQLCGRRQGRDRGKGDTAPPPADPMKDTWAPSLKIRSWETEKHMLLIQRQEADFSAVMEETWDPPPASFRLDRGDTAHAWGDFLL